jgi:two-component system chemotaxis response regulator CheY
MNILVVDDSVMMRGVVKQAIESNASNIDVTFFDADDGQQALDCMKENTIDLVFLDWNMPVLDGLEFVKQARGDGIKIPIIMVTSVTDKDKILEAGKSGINGYVEKPVRGPALWEQIKEFVK